MKNNIFVSASYYAPQLKFRRLTEFGFAPQRRSPCAAGYDLRSAQNAVVLNFDRKAIATDIAIQLPPNCYGRIAPRSGLALRHFIGVGAGVIDRDYTGNIYVLLFNHSNVDYYIDRGDRIAQLICEKYVVPELCEIDRFHTIGDEYVSGFGSSGY